MEKTPVCKGRYLIHYSKEEINKLNAISDATRAMTLDIMEIGSSDQSSSSELKLYKARLAGGVFHDVIHENLSIDVAARLIESIKNVQL
jgi:hypothetical protein